MMTIMLSLGELEFEPHAKKVPDGQQHHKSIYELEGKFENSGHKQGAKFNSEQRMKTLGY